MSMALTSLLTLDSVKFNNSFYANYTTSYFSVITRYGDTINYATKISFKGMFNASIGTDVQETTSDTANLKSKRYMADAKFRYRFFSRLLFFYISAHG